VRNAGWRGELPAPREDVSPAGRPFSFIEMDEALDPRASMLTWVLGREVEFVGPFFVSCDHGCAHGNKTHAVAGGCIGDLDSTERAALQRRVHAVNLARIRRADFVFAHVDEVDCFGTLAEIGFAFGVCVSVHLFLGPNLTRAQRNDLWFVEKFATAVYPGTSIRIAFLAALNRESLLHG
jgi:hypothetical protein